MGASSQTSIFVATSLRLLKVSLKTFWVTCTVFLATAPSVLIHSMVRNEPASLAVMLTIVEGLGSIIGVLTLIMLFLVVLLWSLGALNRPS